LALAVAHSPSLLAQLDFSFTWQLTGIAVAAAGLSLFRVFGSGESNNYDVAWTLYGFTLVRLGVPAAILVICISNVVTLLSRRYSWPWYIHAFNISSFVIAAWLGNSAREFVLAQLPLPATLTALIAILTAIAVFTFANHIHVYGIVWITERVSPRRSGFFSAASLLADATLLGLGTLCALAAEVNPFAIILGAAPLYLLWNALRIPRLEQQAQTDAKTGLFHSKVFTERASLEFERARRLNRPLSLLLLDLDFLRDVNNTHGHLAGDRAIQAIASILKGGAREDDVAARLGGEEFAVLLIEHDIGAALLRAEGLRAAIAALELPLEGGQSFKITASIGAAQQRVDDATLEALIARADEALYAAKRAGRNRVFANDVAEAPITVAMPAHESVPLGQ
jgi:diguanylate cyclase (GGDEF)-like protein